MGYSSAMNQMGGVIATLLSGLLANIVWRASFLVYLLGLLSIVLCAVFLPSDNIAETETDAEKRKKCDGKAFASENVLSEEKPKNSGITAIFKENYPFVIARFLLMTIFFIYPANYAMETAAEGQIPQKYVAAIMAWADFIAFFGGLAFVAIKRIFGRYMKFAAPVCFLTGYILLSLHEGFAGAIAGSFLIGLANGTGIPFIISAVSIKNGKTAATTVMPLISAALYLAQFLCPFLMSAVTSVFGAEPLICLTAPPPYCRSYFFCGPRSSAKPSRRQKKNSGRTIFQSAENDSAAKSSSSLRRQDQNSDSIPFGSKNAVLFTEFFSLRYRKVRRYSILVLFPGRSSMMQPSSSGSARTTRLRSVSLSRPPE